MQDAVGALKGALGQAGVGGAEQVGGGLGRAVGIGGVEAIDELAGLWLVAAAAEREQADHLTGQQQVVGGELASVTEQRLGPGDVAPGQAQPGALAQGLGVDGRVAAGLRDGGQGRLGGVELTEQPQGAGEGEAGLVVVGLALDVGHQKVAGPLGIAVGDGDQRGIAGLGRRRTLADPRPLALAAEIGPDGPGDGPGVEAVALLAGAIGLGGALVRGSRRAGLAGLAARSATQGRAQGQGQRQGQEGRDSEPRRHGQKFWAAHRRLSTRAAALGSAAGRRGAAEGCAAGQGPGDAC